MSYMSPSLFCAPSFPAHAKIRVSQNSTLSADSLSVHPIAVRLNADTRIIRAKLAPRAVLTDTEPAAVLFPLCHVQSSSMSVASSLILEQLHSR
jgi:hypothetical protein